MDLWKLRYLILLFLTLFISEVDEKTVYDWVFLYVLSQ